MTSSDDHTTHRHWLGRAVESFATNVAGAEPDAPVPSCPDWTSIDMVEHLVMIHRWATRVLHSGAAQEYEPAEAPPDARGSATRLADWYRDEAARLRQALDGVDPEASCWNFSGADERFGFWSRRQAHEVTVHSIDAARAAGQSVNDAAAAVDPAVATDGIDELLTMFGPRMARRGTFPDLTEPLTIALSDVNCAWTVHPPDGGPCRVADGADDGAAATLSGPAALVLLVLWNRVPVDGLDVAGERSAVDRYLASRRSP